MDNNKKSALLNAAKKLKTARKPTEQPDGTKNIKTTTNTNLTDKIKSAVSKVNRE